MKTIAAFVATLIFSASLLAQQTTMPTYPPQNKDVLSLDASASTEVVPDTAFVTLASEITGADAGAITREVQQIINAGLAQAKDTKGIEARTGGFNTQQRWNNKGVRDGWTVRAELILKSKDFGTLGTLAGKLAQQKLMIANTGFEMSRAQREREEAALIESAVNAFKTKASAAAKAFGFSNYSLREVNLGSIGGGVQPRPEMLMSVRAKVATADAEAMSIEGGKTVLTLSVSGSVAMSK
ncbi:MAG: SIMPL domain-containing protein [Casimicrobium sp.]